MTADVEAFVRLAVDSVHRLIGDERLAAELADAAVAATDDPMERLQAAQRVLARVLAYERATLGAALTVDEVEEWLRRRRLDVEDAMRLLYELSLGGGRSWPAVQFAASSDDESAESVTDPWLRALRLLVRPEAASAASRKVRRAVAGARSQPLGFARLVLEVADDTPTSEDEASPLAQVGERLDDAWLRREAPDVSFDLRARCAAYRADVARRRGQLDDSKEHLETASELLGAGTGDPVVASLVHEARAGLALAQGDQDEAMRWFSLAADRLASPSSPPAVSPSDAAGEEARHRLVEIELKRALVLARDASRRREAGTVLSSLGESLADSSTTASSETANDIDPELRLRVALACARVELDLARQAVAEQDPFGIEDGAPEVVLASYAQSWTNQASRLDRAAVWLHTAEFWLDAAGERARAEHEWLQGLTLLLTDRRMAAEALRRSLARFRTLGDERTVRQISIDLIVSGVLAGALGDDDVDDGSEPLKLFRQLIAARTRT